MSINKKKVAASVTAVGLAALLLLGGTFAWQSISQTALNEASNVVNPGGRLHDDFDGENKDVYVENFADDAIYARIRLDEYFEIVQNKGTPAETINSIAGTKDADGNIETWETHYFGSENATDEYWKWLTGGSTTYMPTFNKNKDSLAADVNGTYNGLDGIVTDEDSDDRYTDYIEYTDGETKTDEAIYDADTNDTEDENVTSVSEEHTAQSTLGATLMSMQEWIDEGSQPGEYWVYDTDGWVYWAQAIEPDTATGLLLDGIELTQVMDDSWYYAINVIAQFVTADDLGQSDNTGFYADGETVSDDALALLEAIGVDVIENVVVPETKEDGVHLSLLQNPGAVLTDDVWYYEAGVPTEGTIDTWQVSAELWADGAEVTDVNYTYLITSAPLSISDDSIPAPDEGIQNVFDVFVLDTTTGILNCNDQSIYSIEITVTATDSEGTELGNSTIKLMRAVPIELLDLEGHGGVVAEGGSINLQLNSEETNYQLYNFTCEMAEGSCSGLSIEYAGDGKYKITHSEGTCDGNGGTAVVYLTGSRQLGGPEGGYPQVRAEFPIICE